MTASMMFVPGNAPDRFRKAQGTAAGALILDLEDSVPHTGKDEARANVVEMIRSAQKHQQIWVRVNALSTGLMLKDLAAVVPARPFGVVIPKCSGNATLVPVQHYLDALEAASDVPAGATKILAIVTETARSMFHLGEYDNTSGRIWGLTWGAEDLGADVGSISNRDGAGYSEPFRLARSLCLFAAAAAGVRPIDTVCVAINDAELVKKESEESFRDGFVGKMAIHPAQVAPINAAFSYSAAQLDWARQVIGAFAQNPGQGALRLDGKMIDEPHLKLARRMLGESS